MSLTRWQRHGMIVVAKPSGLPTQGAKGQSDSLVAQLEAAFPYVGLHHRLDQPASGLLLLTTSKKANRWVAQLLRKRTLQRTYLAVLAGEVEPGEWTLPVDGKEARTTVQVLATSHGMSAVRLELHTGRKHQIRVQAAMMGHPVVGDRRYGGEVGRAWSRLALHACELRFPTPDGGSQEIHEPLPADLTELWTTVAPRTDT